MSDFRIIIPVRYDSVRLPGKALIDLGDKPIIQHVYEQCLHSGAESIVIATDHKRIASVAKSFGAQVCMTSTDNQSGIERLAEAVVALGYADDEIIVYVQGDAPMVSPKSIRMVAEDLPLHDNVKVATICDEIQSADELFDPNVVKVVLNHRNYAVYFSRALIPWERDTFTDRQKVVPSGQHYRHIGLYAFRAGFLQQYVSWDPCPLDEMECLEALRVLWHGGKIHMIVSKIKLFASIDTEADLQAVREHLKISEHPHAL